MKLLCVLTFCIILHYGSANWLADVFTGLNEAVEDRVDKKLWDGLKQKVKDNVKKVNLFEKAPLVKEGVEIFKKHWGDAENKFDGEKKKYLDQWNELIKKMYSGNTENAQRILHKFKKVSHKLKKLLHADLYQEMKKSASTVVKEFKQKVEEAGTKVEEIKKTLKDKVVNWKEPSFMKNVMETKKDLKDYIKGAIKLVNKHVKQATHIINKLKKKENDEEEDPVEEEEEKKLSKWIGKYFVKPHMAAKTFDCDADCQAKLSKYWDGIQNLKHQSKKEALKDAMKFMKSIISKGDNKFVKKMGEDVMPIIIDVITPSEKNENKKEEVEKKTDEVNEEEKKWKENFEKSEMGKMLKPKPDSGNDDDDDMTLTGNENWDIYKQYRKEVMGIVPAPKEVIKARKLIKAIEMKDQDKALKKKMKINDWESVLKKVASEKFGDDMVKEGSKWFSLKRGVLNKLKKMEKFLKK